MAKYIPSDRALLFQELRDENDRSTIIVGVAFLEYILECTIESKLRQMKNKKDKDLLFSENGLFPSLSTKIFAAYALEIIGDVQRKNCDLLRKIRNEVAHNMNPTSFDSEKIRAQCNELKFVKPLEYSNERKELRARFIHMIEMLSLALESTILTGILSKKKVEREVKEITLNIERLAKDILFI